MIEANTILYLANEVDSSNRILAGLEEQGYEVVSTVSPTEVVALLYVTQSVAAVILDEKAVADAGFDVSQSLQEIHPNVPVLLLCGDQIESSPTWAEKCVGRDKLISALQAMLTSEPVT